MDIFLRRHGTEVFRVAVLVWGLTRLLRGVLVPLTYIS